MHRAKSTSGVTRLLAGMRRHNARLLEALALIVFAWLINMLPMRVYTQTLGHRGSTALAASPRQLDVARRVAAATVAVSARMPFQAACIEQAIATRLSLRLRGIPATAYIGVHRDPELRHAGRYNAHAWLQVGDCVVIGGPDVSDFVPLAWFA